MTSRWTKGICWDELYAARVFDWAGHLARMREYDKHRVAAMELRRKDRNFLKHLEKTQGSQCHGWRFHVWRWERRVYDFWEYYGKDWMKEAGDKDKWQEAKDQFVRWAVVTWSASVALAPPSRPGSRRE